MMILVDFGILTFYDVINYGAALQAYALQKKIEDLGKTSEFIHYIGSQENNDSLHTLKYYFIVLKQIRCNLKTYLTIRKAGEKKIAQFSNFRERYMKQSRKHYRLIEELSADESLYSGFIAGSDMVWSDIGQNLDVYFLTFAPEYKRLSYAPSLTGREGETEEEQEKYKTWINGISWLSCREKYGIDYISRVAGRNAKKVIDPTLLFDKAQWKDKLGLSEQKIKPYILCYLFQGIKPEIQNKLEFYSKVYKIDIKYIPMSPKEIIYNLKHGFDTAYGPREFVEAFLNADYVFTNSFHGLLFSLIMNKPFYLFHREEGNEWAKHEERMNNILELVGLQNRFIHAKELPARLDFDIEYSFVNEKLENLREESVGYLFQALNSVTEYKKIPSVKESLNRIDDLSVKKCTGCASCIQTCPVQAIHMEASKEGFLFPIIDMMHCINCGLCAKKCPIISPLSFKYPQKTFCGFGNNPMIKKSASGGAFVTFAKYIIEEEDGIVYGAALIMPEGVCRHIGVDSVENLYQLQNSKYVQSDISMVLPECRKELRNERKVLFSGTPCQIAALKCYLGWEYENLYTVDLICHGVPSPTFLKAYIQNEIEKGVCDLRFRHKLEAKTRRSAFDINYDINGKIVLKAGDADLYYAPFIRGESYRECCYDCQYAREERVSDITIGDCDSWRLYIGLEENNLLSSILLNTERGLELWEKTRQMFTYLSMDYKEECIINHQLRRPTVRPARRDSIYQELYEGWDVYREKNKTKRSPLVLKIKKMIVKILG